MGHTLFTSVAWVVAGILLVLYLMRRRSRKAER